MRRQSDGSNAMKGTYGVVRCARSRRRGGLGRVAVMLVLSVLAGWLLSGCTAPLKLSGEEWAMVTMGVIFAALVVLAVRKTRELDNAWWQAWQEREEDWRVARQRMRREFWEDCLVPHDLPRFEVGPLESVGEPPTEILPNGLPRAEDGEVWEDLETLRGGDSEISQPPSLPVSPSGKGVAS
jgi:hypothetical protein